MSEQVTKRARVDGPEAKVATCTAPVNIAVIKYWGKRDEEKILPINSSVSGTLSQKELHAKTTTMASPAFQKDRIWLNGKEEDIGNKRLQRCLSEIRALAKAKHGHALNDWKVHICSANNFPTAAGLASSAAGYAALVVSLAQLFNVEDAELTGIARMGSGSACRSLAGGFVRWNMGERDDGKDSIATQVVPEHHWPEMEVLILVVNAGKKGTSSTTGMETSVKTSTLIGHRADVVVPQRMAELEKALHDKDFETFARATMQDSNQFHAVCLDTFPPISYMNDVSRTIITVLTRFNNFSSETKAAYTFDAGPNAVIYALKKDMPAIIALINEYFPPVEATADNFFRGRTTEKPSQPVSQALKDAVGVEPTPGGVQYILHTGVGEGPQILEPKDSLLNEDGLPK